MADDSLTIDPLTVLDNGDARQVEFIAELDGERHAFAVLYDALEALDGAAPDDNAAEAFVRHRHAVERASIAAFGRDTDQALTIISENDLD